MLIKLGNMQEPTNPKQQDLMKQIFLSMDSSPL